MGGEIVGWLWLWLLFVIVLFFLPLGYGWGYRGWGPPYPSYYRRRGYAPAEAEVAAAEAREVESGWGVLADVIWIVLLVAVIWLVLALIF